jgi:hypothetical protein
MAIARAALPKRVVQSDFAGGRRMKAMAQGATRDL